MTTRMRLTYTDWCVARSQITGQEYANNGDMFLALWPKIQAGDLDLCDGISENAYWNRHDSEYAVILNNQLVILVIRTGVQSPSVRLYYQGKNDCNIGDFCYDAKTHTAMPVTAGRSLRDYANHSKLVSFNGFLKLLHDCDVKFDDETPEFFIRKFTLQDQTLKQTYTEYCETQAMLSRRYYTNNMDMFLAMWPEIQAKIQTANLDLTDKLSLFTNQGENDGVYAVVLNGQIVLLKITTDKNKLQPAALILYRRKYGDEISDMVYDPQRTMTFPIWGIGKNFRAYARDSKLISFNGFLSLLHDCNVVFKNESPEYFANTFTIQN